MNHRKLNLLLHPLFVISVLLLLLNDIFLKYSYHNWLTGKLSDFTGLFTFALFLLAFFPRHSRAVILCCGLFFIYWKSPLSTSFIQCINRFSPFQVERVVDYTDLLALVMLPVAWMVVKKPYHPPAQYRQLLLSLSCLVSLFAFCNTSAIKHILYEHPANYISFQQEISTHKSEEEVLQLLTAGKGSYRMDSVHFFPSMQADFFYRIQSPGDSLQWVPLTNKRDSAIYIRVKDYHTYYIVPGYILEGDRLENLEFRFLKGVKKNTVIIESFFTDAHPANELYSGKLKRKYRRHFKELLKSAG